MADVRLHQATKAFGDTPVLRGIDLDIADGEFVVFVGPSGCGKSTLLRVIAGLEELSGGTVSIGGRVVNDVAPAERGIAMVFQSYALYPHMTVAENLAFALKMQGMPRAERDAAVANAAETLDITALLDRKPCQLSGGQRQRVAIGRAIVRQPQVFLFDEPLSNLDAGLRMKMRYEFAGLHETLGTTMIYVTHDQVEAMTLADRIVVLNAGRIEQVGTPADLYASPDTLFVAGFIGSPRMNLIPATIVGAISDGTVVRIGDGIEVETRIAGNVGDVVTLGIRPEHIDKNGPIAATIRFVESLGSTHFAYCSVAGIADPVIVACAERPVAETLSIGIRAESAHLFDDAGHTLARRLLQTRNAA